MNGTFEDRLLDELKTEISARAAHGRAPARPRLNRRRIMGGTAIVGLAAAAAVAVPLMFGPATPAYALTTNPDSSINLRINEFRDPDQVEEDLARLGVPADITYLPLGKRCAAARAPLVPGDRVTTTPEELKSKDPAVQARLGERAMNTASAKAIRAKNGITIYPQHIKPGQIVLIEVMENPVEPTVEHPGVAWEFAGRLTGGPVAPCQAIDDPSAFDIGDATPPPGN